MDENEQMVGEPQVVDEDFNPNIGPLRITEAEFDKVFKPNDVEVRAAAMTAPTMEGFRNTSSLWNKIRLAANKRKLDKRAEIYNDKLHEVEKFTKRVENYSAGNKLGNLVNSRRAQKAGKALSKLGVKIVDLQNTRAHLEGKPKAIKVPPRVVETSKILQAVGWYKFQEKRAEKKIIREEVKRIVSEAKQERTGDFSNLKQENLADFVIEKMKERGFEEREAKSPVARFSDEDHLDNPVIAEFIAAMIDSVGAGSLSEAERAKFKAFCDEHGLDFDEELSLAVDTNKAFGIPVGVSLETQELTAMDLAERIKDSYAQQKANFDNTLISAQALTDILKTNVSSILNEEELKAETEKTNIEKAYQNLVQAEARLKAHEMSGVNDPQRTEQLKQEVAAARSVVSKINEEALKEADSIITKSQEPVIEEVKEEKPKSYKEQLEEAREDLVRAQKELNEFRAANLENPELKTSLEEKLDQATANLSNLYTQSTRELETKEVPEQKAEEAVVEEPLDISKLSMKDALQLIFPESKELRSEMNVNDLLNFRRDHILELENIREQKEAAPEAEAYDRYRELELLEALTRNNIISEDKESKYSSAYIEELQEIRSRQSQRAEEKRAEAQEPWLERREELIAANRKRAEAVRQRVAEREVQRSDDAKLAERKAEADKYREQFRKLGSDYSSISDNDVIELVTTSLNDKAKQAISRQVELYDQYAQTVPKDAYKDEERWHSAVVSAAKERFNQEKTVSTARPQVSTEEEMRRSR